MYKVQCLKKKRNLFAIFVRLALCDRLKIRCHTLTSTDKTVFCPIWLPFMVIWIRWKVTWDNMKGHVGQGQPKTHDSGRWAHINVKLHFRQWTLQQSPTCRLNWNNHLLSSIILCLSSKIRLLSSITTWKFVLQNKIICTETKIQLNLFPF